MAEEDDIEDLRKEAPSQRDTRLGSLVALALLALFVVAAVWTVSVVRSANAVQDCVLQGRRNCAPTQAGNG